jgi:hypothetical protein
LDAMERPGGACVLCRPPLGTRSWVRAYSGHLTCETCEDKLGTRLVEITTRYEKLSPRPSSSQASDGMPGPKGFESKAPASEHVIAMMDNRSSPVARVWIGGDGRIHRESERPPLSVYTTLLVEVYDVAERREMALPDPCWQVRHLTAWLDRHVNWLTTQESVVEFAEVLRELNRQLKPAVGERGKKPFGSCPVVLENPTRTCGGPLFAPPVTSSIIRCGQCGKEWDHAKHEWVQLGKLVRA